MNNITLNGDWCFIVRNNNGKILQKINKTNLILNTGKETVAKLICGLTSDYFLTIAIGTGTSTDGPHETDAGLYNEYQYNVATRTYIPDYKCQFYNRFTVTEDITITEAGIRRSGVYLNHTMFDIPISLSSGQYLDVYCTITVS